MPANVVQEASLTTRVTSWLSSQPFVTCCILVTCVAIYLLGVLTGFDDFKNLCMSPFYLLENWQLYRPFSAILIHNGILHIAFNMLSFVPMGTGLERILGSVRYAYAVLLFAVTNAVLHTAAAYAVSFRLPDLVYQCSVGFSGILFAMIVVETNMSGVQSRTIFGLFTVPAKWYPWALLVVFQVLMPNVSLLGHLSGLLSGLAFSYGWLNWALLGSSTIAAIESSTLLIFITGIFVGIRLWKVLAPLVRRSQFIVGGSNPGSSLPTTSSDSSSGSSWARLSGGLSGMWRRMQGWGPVQTQGPEGSTQFPGRGRTLGGPSPGTPTGQGPGLTPLRRENSINAGPPRSGHVGGNGGRQSPPPSGPGRPEANGAVSSQKVDGQAVAQLVSMGFDQVSVRSALVAANGDIGLAVEFLCTN